MSDSSASQRPPALLKYLSPSEVQAHLARDPRLIVPVGTTEQHGPHLPLGCDTIVLERLADDLSAEFQVLRAPTIEYGVNARTVRRFPGSASAHEKTLHLLLNDLVGDWEAGGVEEFIILTAHGPDPHQQALSTIRTKRARVRTVNIFSVPLPVEGGEDPSVTHGGELDTSLLMYVDGRLVHLERAQDYEPGRWVTRRYHLGRRGAIPADSPGSLGRPSHASAEKGRELYQIIFQRIADRIFRTP